MTFLIYILAFAVLLGVLVTIHEFGHFIFARMFKVHVQRFSIGMGPVFYKKYDNNLMPTNMIIDLFNISFEIKIAEWKLIK